MKYCFDSVKKNYKSFLKLKISEEVLMYQIKMIDINIIQGILPITYTTFNNEKSIEYDITSKMSIERFIENSKQKTDINNILLSICDVLCDSYKYLLNMNNFIIHERYIFIDPKNMKLFLIYIPLYNDEENCLEDIVNMSKRISNNFFCWDELVKRDKINSLEDFMRTINENREIGKCDLKVKENEEKNLKIEYCEEDSKVIEDENEEDKKANIKFQVLIQAVISAIIILLGTAKINDVISLVGVVIVVLGINILIIIRKLRLIKEVKQKKNNVFEKIFTYKNVQTKYYNNEEAFFQVAEENRGYGETVLLNNDIEAKAVVEIGGNSYSIENDAFFIGRLKGNVDCYIDSMAVGKIHAQIIRKEKKFYLIDHNSKNGTFLNGVKLASNIEYLLNTEDKINFANNECCFSILKGEDKTCMLSYS